jgi:hypothetical protein
MKHSIIVFKSQPTHKRCLLHKDPHMILDLSAVFSTIFQNWEDVKLISGEDCALLSKNYPLSDNCPLEGFTSFIRRIFIQTYVGCKMFFQT